MTEQVKPKSKPGRKPKAVVEPTTVVETPEVVKQDAVEPTQEASSEPIVIAEAQGTTEDEIVVEPTQEAAEPVTVNEPKTEQVEVEAVPVVLDEKFKPILRPTNVKGEAVGHMPVPKAIFEMVTKDSDWRSKIETHNAKVGLQSVLYWLTKNGELRVRCMSSSRFGDVL